ncbi:MAG TPA: CoA transferase, partial [Advenella sp.]|nr:CoA transferase [Advenella sp.]
TGSIVKKQPTEYWLQLCREQEIPAARVNALSQLEQDPHLQSAGFFAELNDQGQRYRFTNNPVRLSNSAVPLKMPPRLGEHTQEILNQLGYSPQKINHLRAQHIVGAHQPDQTT